MEKVSHEEINVFDGVDSGSEFSQLLEASGMSENREYKIGDVVEGAIIEIGSEYAYVDLGSKSEGIISISELINEEDGKVSHVIGSEIKGKVVGFERGGVMLSRSLQSGGNIALEEAFDAGTSVKGLVEGTNKGGFDVKVMGQRAFCPISQMDRGRIEDSSVFVGQSFDFKIKKYGRKGRDIVLSRVALLDELDAMKREETLAGLSVGSVYDGTVRTVTDYGLFVDIGGIEGLVHASEVSYEYIENLPERFKEGDSVKVKVLSVEDVQGKRRNQKRIGLSIKQLGPDPFTEAIGSLRAGERVRGKVVRNVDFGSFVDLAPGVQGLVHVREMSWERRHIKPSDIVKEGDEVEVVIISVDEDSRRIELSLKALTESPWENITERLVLGETAKGVVENVDRFGVFVRLGEGLTGLMPFGEVEGGESAARNQYSSGQDVELRVLSIDVDRERITLSSRADSEVRSGSSPSVDKDSGRGGKKNAGRRMNKSSDSGVEYKDSGSLGTFGDLFKDLKK